LVRQREVKPARLCALTKLTWKCDWVTWDN